MAFTNSLVAQTVFGNKRVQVYNCTADAASGAVTSSLNVVEWFEYTVQSCATAGGTHKMNLTIGSAACNGCVFVSSVANGDNFFMTIYGH